MADESRFASEATARDYAAARPDYPSELFDALDRLFSGRLGGARVVDVAAGTGIASRQLAARGARVVAVELSEAMLAALAAGSPGIDAVRGSAHALPLADSSVDMATYAQAWHWLDKERAVAQARRVVRPGGVIAIWWNHILFETEWELAQVARFAADAPSWRQYGTDEIPEEYTRTPGLAPQTLVFPWQRTIPIEKHLLNMASRSYINELGDAMPAFLERERRILQGVFPDGRVTERFQTILLAALLDGPGPGEAARGERSDEGSAARGRRSRVQPGFSPGCSED
jgi:SAM-dependent methyltransferase